MARKPAGLEPAPDIGSYDNVPWFRKQWFVFVLVLIPAMIVITLTGDVFAKANKKMRGHSDADVWRYTGGGKAMIIVSGIVLIAVGLISVSG